MKHITLFSIAMIAVLITACSPATSSSLPEPTGTIESSSIPTPVAVPTATPDHLGDVKIYRDSKAGFALEYPAAWFIEDDAAQDVGGSIVYTISLFSWDRASYTPPSKDLNALPDGATMINIMVFNQGPGSLDEAISQYKNQDSGAPVKFLKQEDWTLNNGEKAAYIESEGAFGVVANMTTLVNGKVIYVSGDGNLAPIRAIAFTLYAE